MPHIIAEKNDRRKDTIQISLCCHILVPHSTKQIIHASFLSKAANEFACCSLFKRDMVNETGKEQRAILIKALGNKIRTIRRGKDLTQERVAGLAGINPKYLGEIERGEKNPTAVVIKRLSNALNVPPCQLFSAGCPNVSTGIQAVIRLFGGRKEKEQQKAIKILEVFFE
jgi:transcriptional regulator with XRE-family HTH domain